MRTHPVDGLDSSPAHTPGKGRSEAVRAVGIKQVLMPSCRRRGLGSRDILATRAEFWSAGSWRNWMPCLSRFSAGLPGVRLSGQRWLLSCGAARPLVGVASVLSLHAAGSVEASTAPSGLRFFPETNAWRLRTSCRQAPCLLAAGHPCTGGLPPWVALGAWKPHQPVPMSCTVSMNSVWPSAVVETTEGACLLC